MSLWPDANAREAFVREVETHFSLIAPAGVGKTHSIVQRVLEIARRDPEVALPRLVVVTYTRRAAGEMRDRIHAELLASGAPPQVFEAMEQAFFGTIHAFCTRLLRLYGAYIGLPTILEPAPHPIRLWERFLFSPEGELAIAAAVGALGPAARHVRIQELLQTPPAAGGETVPYSLSEPDFSELLSEGRISEARASSRENVREGQRLAARWLERFRNETSFLPLPDYSKGGKKFLTAWEAVFGPIRAWVQAHVCNALSTMEVHYRKQRLEQGQLLYSDQIAFAAELLRHPRAGALLRGQNVSVILDEAQDTDPLQFEVLFEISEGRVSMVGDPQQSIYGDRASLSVYRQFQKRLCESPQSRELQYQLTFRCRPSILSFVNEAGPDLLDGQKGQVDFVPLQSACEGDVGQVVRWLAPCKDEKGTPPPTQSKYLVADEMAEWLRRTGFEALRARDWSEVAILCPRKRWLETLAFALRKRGLSVQIHSERSLLGDSPVYAWWTSLLWVLTHPTDSFEIVGVLREIFALRDSDLATFCEGDPNRLQVKPSASLPALRLLGELLDEVRDLPVRSAVEKILCKTRLLDRLLSLPGEDLQALKSRHAELLAQASDAEVRGVTLEEFAQELRDHFETPAESPEVRPGSVQLMTCQKAKGLEWDAVIVPYFFRKISFRMANAAPENESLLTHRVQEMQRLLYVTLTRARNTLVISDDSAFFSPKKFSSENSKTFSFAEILGKAGLQAFHNLPQEVTSDNWGSRQAPSSEKIGPSVSADIRAVCWESVRRLAAHFPRKLTPHSLAEKGRHSENGEQAPLSPALGRDYGIWWHECAEAFSFHHSQWGTHLEKMLQKCPDAERGRREWTLFSQTALAARLASGNYLLHTEMPLFFLQEDMAVEGIMDLAALHRTQNNWLLIDWKTDRINDPSELINRYQDQLRAYARGLSILTTREVEAGFYAVSLGEWVPLGSCKF